jgi:hypothetical protein
MSDDRYACVRLASSRHDRSRPRILHELKPEEGLDPPDRITEGIVMRGACAIRGVDSGLLSVAIMGAVGLFFAAFPSLGSRLFANDPAALESAKINLVWSGRAYAFYGLG